MWFRFRLKVLVWRLEAGSLLKLAWLFAKLQAIRAARRLLDKMLPPRQEASPLRKFAKI